MKKLLKTLPYIAIALLVGITAVYASNTTSLIPSGSASNTMYSLTDIWNLASGTIIDENTGTIEATPSEVALSGKSLSDVYTALSTEIAKLSPNVIKVGTTAFGKIGAVTAGTPAPTFASTDQTTYSCEALTTDPIQPAVTLQTICGYHSTDGCSWVGSACTGGTKTPSEGYMTWYAAIASCAEKSDEGSSSWRLPTTPELVTHFFTNNNSGNPPTGFVVGYYWSGTTYQNPNNESVADYVGPYGYADGEVKRNPYNLVHCAR